MKNKMKKVNEELNTTRKDFLKARNSLDKTN